MKEKDKVVSRRGGRRGKREEKEEEEEVSKRGRGRRGG